MEYIASPWRAEYVKKVFQTKGCVFCQAQKSKDPAEAFILARAEHNFVLLNKYPYTPGHLIIAPLAHLDSLEKASRDSSAELIELLKLCLTLLREHYRPHGFNTGMNLGQSAGAGVIHHYHTHVIPRWTGDSNFMPLVGNTKVVIETLDSTYAQLQPLFQKAGFTKGT
jgi:ATP adenylyltransferase